MSGAMVYQLNVYRLARSIAGLEEHIRITAGILEGIPRDTARTRHELFSQHIEFLEDSLVILQKRYATQVGRIR
jgi:phage terminase Nu1 subunit (DNA packaging protein)